MKRLFATVALLATLIPIGHAAAGEIALYTHAEFRGPQVTVRGTTTNFEHMAFNDRVSSVVVRSGTWELCEHKDFGGRCIVLERGEYPMLNGFNDVASSAREVDRRRDRDGYRGDGRNEHGDRNDRRDDWRDRRGDDRRGPPVELYGARNFSGDRVALGGDLHSLRSKDFNDRAGSLIVREGEWEVCEHDDYRGRCRVFGPGRYPAMEGLNNQASSVRRVR
ncbi:beta/gamma crystallin-related protein [Pseudoduganella lutea]|uniref:Beta/gamma crystallin 'Greek key' domain-containing protein n=1 Tax=Pseudoduganella lutea TaxID=321985 RepID=A0A4P6KXX8_9BURK|nr:beta/gamma crystallin-related protein [Pseudoduganella lutea]QBE63880.1 hypothetical protein EWM63_13520 [Pseudoduganella lutea]